LIVIIAFTLRYVAFGWTSMKLSMAGMDPSLTDAARVFGASRWQMLAHVCWPQIAPMVFAAAYIVFLLGLWDVESIIMVVPPGGETLSLRVFNLLHYGHNAQVNALCATLLFVAISPLLIWRVGAFLASLRLKVICGLPLLLLLSGCNQGADR